MKHFIFKYTRNKGQIGSKIVGLLILLVFGLSCILIPFTSSSSTNLGAILSFWIIGIGFILASFYGLSYFLESYGLVIQNGKLSTIKVLFGSVHKKSRINTSWITGIDILTFDCLSHEGYQRMNIELSSTDYRVYLLNEDHSKRKLICATFNKTEANEVTEFLSSELNIDRVKYNPPAARRRKRRR